MNQPTRTVTDSHAVKFPTNSSTLTLLRFYITFSVIFNETRSKKNISYSYALNRSIRAFTRRIPCTMANIVQFLTNVSVNIRSHCSPRCLSILLEKARKTGKRVARKFIKSEGTWILTTVNLKKAIQLTSKKHESLVRGCVN